MGVPSSEVGYTSAMLRREDHEVHKDMCWHWGGGTYKQICIRNNTKDIIFYVNKNPTDATVCRYLFIAKLLYMFRVSQHPSSGVLKTVTAASGTGHNTGTATSLQCGLIRTGLCKSRDLPLDLHKPVPIRPRWRGVAVPVL